MPKKMSVSEKWNDPWFRKLELVEKCLFIYLCDVCDCAGFVEYDPELVEFQTKAPCEELEGAIKGLYPKVVQQGSWLWVVNHIKHQQDYPNKPLNPANKAHQGIWSRLNAHLDIDEVSEFVSGLGVETQAGFIAVNKPNCEGPNKGLTSPTGKGKGNGTSKGKVNSVEEGGAGETLFEAHAAFQEIHAECARVTLQEFEAKVAANRFVVDGETHMPDVDAALADFRLNCASMTTFRPQSAIQKFGNYLKHTIDGQIEVLKNKKKTRAGRHPALG